MRTLAAILGALVVATSVVAAHHSPIIFDRTRQVKLEGVVKEFRWSNPHSWILVDVANGKGAVDTWSIEMGSPNHLAKVGWRASTLKAGDRVSVVVYPLRDGEIGGGQFISLTQADGRVMTEKGPSESVR
jgi:hypothetical protein